MVRQYIRKKDGPGWGKQQLEEAVEAVKSNKMSGYEAAKHFKIPRTTIMDHVTGRRGLKSNSLGRPTVLPTEVEVNLAYCLHVMEKNGFGLSRKEVIELVTVYIKTNNIKNPFKEGVPGHDWFINFATRNNLSLKKPQAVEYSRKKAADPFLLAEYFDILENTINALGLQNKPERMWNIDETSYSNDPKKTKVVGLRGYAATRTTATSGKENTTVLFASNAAGGKGPPFIIFKGKNIWSEWTSEKAYPGTLYYATENGWIETNAFEQYIAKSFIPMINNKEEPTLLIYDGHSTHVQLSVIEKAKENNITIIKLPAHSSHLLQPLDLAVFKAFKDRWDEKMVKWQRLHIGEKLPKKEFAVLIGEVWENLDPQIIRNGFKKGGIHPFNRDVILEGKLDLNALKRWKRQKEHGTINRCYDTAVVTTKIPSTLIAMCLKKINTLTEDLMRSDVIQSYSQVALTSHLPVSQINKSLKTLSPPAENSSFEDLLLKTMKMAKTEIIKKKKVKIASAELITHDDVIRKLEEKEQEKRLKATKQKRIKKTTTHNTKNTMKKKSPSSSIKTDRKSSSASPKASISKCVPVVNILEDKYLSNDEKLVFEDLVTKTDEIFIIEKDTVLSNTKKKKENAKLTRSKCDKIEEQGMMKFKSEMKNKRCKIQKKKTYVKKEYSSEDESDYSVHDSSDLENMEDYINTYLVSDNENLENIDPEVTFELCDLNYVAETSHKVKKGDWVLVQFCAKKSIKHFVGEVLNVRENNIPTIKYVRKVRSIKQNSAFTYPKIQDICELKHVDDIITILPHPTISRRGQIIFKIEFGNYNIQ